MKMSDKVEVRGDDNCQVEIQARHLLDVSFKYFWKIENYFKIVEQGLSIDSPTFHVNANGLKTEWSMALRFWTNEDGRKLTNPVVVCLNLVSSSPGSETMESENVQIRYNFGVWNDVVKQYEVSPTGVQKVTLSPLPKEQQSLQSIAVRDVLILDRHLIDRKNIDIFCKIYVVRDKVEEQHSLALDLWNKLVTNEKTDICLRSSDGDAIPAHKLLLSSRSRVLAQLIETANGVLTLEVTTQILKSLLQYIYTDRVDPLDSPQVLIRFADSLELPGLKNICERELIDSITPQNVASLLLVADNFNCELLKKACMGYCEDNPHSIVKTVAWKVMEKVNPGLFEEVCQK